MFFHYLWKYREKCKVFNWYPCKNVAIFFGVLFKIQKILHLFLLLGKNHRFLLQQEIFVFGILEFFVFLIVLLDSQIYNLPLFFIFDDWKCLKRHEEIPQGNILTRTYKNKSYDMNFILFKVFIQVIKAYSSFFYV